MLGRLGINVTAGVIASSSASTGRAYRRPGRLAVGGGTDDATVYDVAH
ncbi:MAG: hypothetical protein LC749_11890 [Actinobacteria bacterium]|nr:hypothetical protein [Actinomycetota bacterium]